MENNQPQLNEHNKTEYPPMHNGEFDTSPTKKPRYNASIICTIA